ncbi:hypothetical protein SFC66_07765 [Terribacillus saccharophilus]
MHNQFGGTYITVWTTCPTEVRGDKDEGDPTLVSTAPTSLIIGKDRKSLG